MCPFLEERKSEQKTPESATKSSDGLCSNTVGVGKGDWTTRDLLTTFWTPREQKEEVLVQYLVGYMFGHLLTPWWVQGHSRDTFGETPVGYLLETFVINSPSSNSVAGLSRGRMLSLSVDLHLWPATIMAQALEST